MAHQLEDPRTAEHRESLRYTVMLKARDRDSARSLSIMLQLGAEDRGHVHQLDTYFALPGGRLKLREQEQESELSYHAAGEEAAGSGSYRTAKVSDPVAVRGALAAKFGVLGVIEKSRRALLWRDVRVRLDDVRGLGTFISLAVSAPDSSQVSGRAHVRGLREALAITDAQLLLGSYCDRLLLTPEGRAPGR